MRSLALAIFCLLSVPVAAADLVGAPIAVGAAILTQSPSLWRGHFSGGRNLDPRAQQIALDWRDDVAFFPGDGACRRWIRDLRRQFATYQGFSGCIRIR